MAACSLNRSSGRMPRSVTSAPNFSKSPRSRCQLASKIAAAGRAAPGSTTSSPVENTATLNLRRTDSRVTPCAAASARSWAVSRRPAGSMIAPAPTSSPAERLLAPRSSPGGTTTASAVLLHENGVGARRHRCAGEDADCLADPECMGGLMTGHGAVDDDQPGVAVGGEIGMAHRKSIHGGIVERRQVFRGDHVGGDHPPQRRAKADLLDFGDRCDALGNQPLHLRNGKQRAGKRKTTRIGTIIVTGLAG
jgi:hypothetical protein